MNSEKYYVYVWYRSDTGRPFYVGKGCGNRYKQKGKTHRNAYFNNICAKHHCWPLIIFDEMTEEEAFSTEIEMIKCLRAKGYVLANMSDGGEGSRGRVITDEYREKYRKMCSGKNNPNYGHKWNDQQKEHLSQVRKQKKIAALGNNPRATSVMCVETGRIYSCQQEATMALGLKSMVSINHALKEKRFTARGLHFVSGVLIGQLNTEEKRCKYLREVEFEKVALHSNM